MKKILSIMVCITIIICLSGCGKNDVLTTKNISEKMISEGFTANDVTNIINDSNIKEARAFNNGVYQFEYYVFKTDKLAKEAYKNNKEAFKKYKTKSSKEKEDSEKNYSKYTLELTDTYDVVIRKKNTIIYASINVENKTNLNKMLGRIKY